MAGARYSPSFMYCIPSRCRSSSTNVVKCLQSDIFPAVISVEVVGVVRLSSGQLRICLLMRCQLLVLVGCNLRMRQSLFLRLR